MPQITGLQEHTSYQYDYTDCSVSFTVSDDHPDQKPQEIHYRKDGEKKQTVCNKRKGESSEVFAYTIDDARKMTEYFAAHGQWLHYLVFVLSSNLGRRNSDIERLIWDDFFDPSTGKLRSNLKTITEKKTGKFASPAINQAVADAIHLYCEKTGCDPAEDDYKKAVLLQLSGPYVGRVMTYSGCYKGIKRAANELGLQRNYGTHSARKFFGWIIKTSHPQDGNVMELLQEIFNHSSTKITNRYIGLTREQANRVIDDAGDVFSEYVIGGKTYKSNTESPIISIDVNDLRAAIACAYEAGYNDSVTATPVESVNRINDLMSMIDDIAK